MPENLNKAAPTCWTSSDKVGASGFGAAEEAPANLPDGTKGGERKGSVAWNGAARNVAHLVLPAGEWRGKD